MAPEQKKLKRVAHHEAGHAVAAWHCSMRFKYVTISPGAGSLGSLVHKRPKWFKPDRDASDRVRCRIERHIVVSFAGQIAEAKWQRRRPRYGYDSDNSHAVDMAFYACGSEQTVNAYLKYCWCASTDVVKVRWKEIRAIAKALLKQKTLSYDDCCNIIMPERAWLVTALAKAAKR